MKKRLNINLKVLLLTAIYLFFHFTNAFFASRHVVADKRLTIVREGTVDMVHLQKSAKTTVCETRLSFSQLIQKASKFFILLFLFAVTAKAINYLYRSKTGSSASPPYLRYCVIRI